MNIWEFAESRKFSRWAQSYQKGSLGSLGYLKFYINIELVILRNRMFFCFSSFDNFVGKMASQSWRQNYFYYETFDDGFSGRTCYEDSKT